MVQVLDLSWSSISSNECERLFKALVCRVHEQNMIEETNITPCGSDSNSLLTGILLVISRACLFGSCSERKFRFGKHWCTGMQCPLASYGMVVFVVKSDRYTSLFVSSQRCRRFPHWFVAIGHFKNHGSLWCYGINLSILPVDILSRSGIMEAN